MRSPAPPLDLDSPTVTVEAAAEYLGISRAMAYAEAKRYRSTYGADGLPNLKFGGRVLVITELLVELLPARAERVVDTDDPSHL